MKAIVLLHSKENYIQKYNHIVHLRPPQCVSQSNFTEGEKK